MYIVSHSSLFTLEVNERKRAGIDEWTVHAPWHRSIHDCDCAPSAQHLLNILKNIIKGRSFTID